MKRILVLLGRYYPNASPNSVCIKNIIECLPSNQYKIDIVGYDDGSKSTDCNLIRVNRGLLQSLIYKYESTPEKRIIVKLLRIIVKMKYVCCFPVWPWTDPIVTRRIKHTVNDMFKKNKYDAIIAVYMPLSSLIVANHIKKEHPQVKYIAYFLDSLSGGYLPQALQNDRYEMKLIKWEQHLISNADKIVFMKSSKKIHDCLYGKSILGKNMVYLDLPMLIHREYNSREKNKKKVLLYIGSLALSIRSPEFILNVFSNITDPELEFIFIGDANSGILNEYAQRDSRIRVLGKCSHSEALEYESCADVLINIGNKNPSLAPSKIFEYMSWGKKIVSTYSIDDDTSVQYLKKYSQALLLDERDDDLITASNKLKDFIYKEEEKVSFDALRNTFEENTPHAFVSMLEELIHD